MDKVITVINSDEYKKKHKTSVRHNNFVKEMKPLSWKEALIIGWSGMRGIVSVATAIALPVTLSSGEVFHQRNSIIFLTVLVVILMLLIQGMGLPILIKLLKMDTIVEKTAIEEDEKIV
jgi:CPA1 family monovalent cation:H+ antiporter